MLYRYPHIVTSLDESPSASLDGHYAGGSTVTGALEEPAAALIRQVGAIGPPGSTIVVDHLRLLGRTESADLCELVPSPRGGPRKALRTGVASLVMEL